MHRKMGKTHSGDHLILDALQRLRNLLLPGGIEIVDTPIEVEFLLKHCHDPIDTLIEKNTLIEVMEDINDNIEKVANKPELKTAIEHIIHTLEEAYPQNRPGR
jgi:hypothetical protein